MFGLLLLALLVGAMLLGSTTAALPPDPMISP
jgi:hypothetical protein